MELSKPRYILRVKLLKIGDLVTVDKGYGKFMKGVIIKILKPGYKYRNSYPWEVRYEVQDCYNKSHTWIGSHTRVKKINDKL